jgi:integrase
MKLHKELHKAGASTVTKNSKAYWRERVYRPVVAGTQVDNYCVQMSCGGVRRTLSLKTPNREAAAETARVWYTYLNVNGWAAFDAKYRAQKQSTPSASAHGAHPDRDDSAVTIGQYLAVVRTESDLHRQTINDYSRALRTVVVGVLKMGTKGKARGRTNQQKWCEGVDFAPLSTLTTDRIETWRRAYIARAQDDELLRRRYITTTNSYIRRSKALFSKRVLGKLRSVKLSEPLPFAGVESGGRPDNRFYGISTPIEDLVSMAVAELDVETLKVFILAIGLGLRRKEIDAAEWAWVDFVNATLMIRPTTDYRLKSHASAAILPLEPEILSLLRGWRASSKSRYVVECEHTLSPRHSYRCETIFQNLIVWLRQKGIDDLKPIHVLRKCFGSRIVTTYGIHAASSALRHRDISTTAAHYVDTRPRVTAGIGPLLVGNEIPIMELKRSLG